MRRGRARHKTLDHDKLQLPFKRGSATQPKFSRVYIVRDKEMDNSEMNNFHKLYLCRFKHTLVRVM